MSHPKYTLIYESNYNSGAYCIYEHAIMEGKVMEQFQCNFRTFDEALNWMKRHTAKPIILACTIEEVGI